MMTNGLPGNLTEIDCRKEKELLSLVATSAATGKILVHLEVVLLIFSEIAIGIPFKIFVKPSQYL